MSLYDLIYSQPSETENNDNDDSQQNSQSNKNTGKGLKSSEKSSKKRKASSTQEKTEEKRKPTDFTKRWRYIDLLPEERRFIDERRRKSRREANEWSKIRLRWKNRKHHFRDEIDYGGAVEAATARVGLKRKAAELRKKEEEQSAHDKTRSPAEENNSGIDSSDDDSDANNEEKYLGSLLERMPGKDDKEKTADVELTQAEKINKMTFQELGYMGHRNPDFMFGKQTKNDTFVLKRAKIDNTISQQREGDSPDEGVTIDTLANDKQECIARHYFPWHDPFRCPSNSRFFHERNSILVAARCIVGGGNQNDETLQNRLLHILYRKSQRDVHRLFLIINLARHQAMDLGLFYTYRWGENQKEVFHQLELGRKHEKRGPPHSLGYTLDNSSLYSALAEYRKRLVTRYSKGRTVLTYDHPSSEELQVRKDHDEENEIEDSDENSEEEQSESESSSDDEREEKSQADEQKEKNNDQSLQKQDPTALNRKGINFPAPTTHYVHTVGSIPPIPSFPLDETAILFGPPDDTNFYSHCADIDEIISSLTTSILLTRLGNGRLQNSTLQMQKAHRELNDYLESLPKNICYDRREFGLHIRSSAPLVPLYSAVMRYCDFLANCGNFSHGYTDFTRSDEINEELCAPVMTGRPKATSIGAADTMNVVAERLVTYLEEYVEDIRLAPFSKPLLITGITTIARYMPPAAAEIFSRSCNSNNFRTPFDLVKLSLEHIESNNLFLGDNDEFEDEEKVNGGLLEIAFNKSARHFENCLEKGDSNPVTHCEWQLAALCGSLLLQSGNEIGGGARCLPSSKRKDSSFSQLFSQSSFATNQAAVYGKRLQLSNFQKVRKQVMDCALKLVNVVNEQKSQRAYLALSSFLEWSEVIALIVGPSSTSIVTNGWTQARRFHAYYTVQWARREKTNAALTRVEELMRWKEVSTDPVLDIIASLVENAPDDLERWKKLVSTLGPVGTECKCSARVNGKQCTLCKRLRKGLCVNHKYLQERKEKMGWWGTSRLSWWDTHLLHLPSMGKKKSKDASSAFTERPKFVFRVSTVVEKVLTNELKKTSIDTFFYEDKKLCGVGISMNQDIDTHWLNYPEDFDDHDDDEDEEDAENYYNSDLPSRFAEVLEQDDGGGMEDDEENTSTSFPQLSRTREGELLTSLCIKVFVTCHLYDVSHSITTSGIWILAKRMWEKQMKGDDSSLEVAKDCDEFRCLSWLSAMGLNVPQILFDLYQTNEQAKIARREKRRKTSQAKIGYR